VRPDGTGLRTIVAPTNLVIADPAWSPDGQQIAYTAWATDYATGGSQARAFVVSADGGMPRVLRTRPADDVEVIPIWSNDGTRLLVSGCATQPNGECTGASSVVPASGGLGVELEMAALPAHDSVIQEWAPDDASIVTTPMDSNGVAIVGSLVSDPLTGRSRPVPWADGGGASSWQRRAP
jgi:hypothetical protein